ncbi:MAG: hypothetical protein ISS19_16330 [Bacteroidales bacterium]|nr:hypothetical protein [Bacteroidales bacterium]
MKKYFYLSATPEALITSHLSSEAFGNYLAVGAKKRTRGQNIFFDLDEEKLVDLPWDYIEKKLVPYENGEPKRSVYLSIYRVLEKIPMEAIKSLYLVTDDGKVLELESVEYKLKDPDMVRLYQQFIPISTRVASRLTPPEFIQFLTDTTKPVSAPKIFFVELQLGLLAKDSYAPIHNLPYPNPDHLRDCLARLKGSKERLTKTVLRSANGELPYRIISDGFFVGERENYLFFQMPSIELLENKYYSWWRSALVQCF